MAKPDPASMHRAVVAEAPAASTAESETAHYAGASARWWQAFAEHGRSGAN